MKKLIYILLCVVAFSMNADFAHARALEGEDFIELDTIVQRTTDCSVETEVCLDIVFAQLRNYEISLNGEPYNGRFPACNVDTIYKANFDNIMQGAASPYELLFFEVDGQNYEITFETFAELVDSIQKWDPISNWKYDTLNNEMISINPSEIHFDPRIEFKDANENTTVLIINRTFVANGTFFFFEEGWNEMILNDTVNNCSDTVDIGIYCADVDTTFLTSDFGIQEEYCFEDLDLIGNTVDVLEILNLNTDNIVTLSEDSCLVYEGIFNGRDTLIYEVCDDLNICDTNVIIIEIINAPTSRDTTIYDTVYINQVDTFCLDYSYDIDAIYNACTESSDGDIIFSIDPINGCLIYAYDRVGVDTACIVIEYENDIRDSFTFIITGAQPDLEVVFDSVFVSQTKEYCLSAEQIGDSILIFEEYCGNTLDFISYSVSDTAELCLEYTGELLEGTDTLCFRICDENNVCDTTLLLITTLPNFGISEVITDRILINFSDTICLENDLVGDIASLENICEEVDGEVSFELDTLTNCIYLTANELGLDTACILATDEFGNTDTNFLIIEVYPPQSDTLILDLDFDQDSIICLPTEELAGAIDQIEDLCPDFNGEQIEYSIDTMNNCLAIETLAPGSDTICLVFCDTFSVCDTQVIVIHVGELPNNENLLIYDTLYTNGIDSFCFEPAYSDIDTIINYCDSSSNEDIAFDFTIDSEVCFSYEFITTGEDTACYEIIYSNGVRDTLHFIITGLEPQVEIIIDTISVNENKQYCLDTSELAGNISFFDEFCQNTLDNIDTDGLIDSNFCWTALGVSGGSADTLCMEICDDNNVCDTTYYVIHVLSLFDTSEYIVDSVLINFTDTICFDNDLSGEIVEIENICPERGGSSVSFELDTINNCLYFTGESIGIDTACILIKDEFGNTDTNFVMITTIFPSIDTILLDVVVGETDTVCIDTSELSSSVNTMFNICPESINKDVMADFIPGTKCIEYTGINANEQDTMCVLFCDSLSICDTVIFVFNVLDTTTIDPLDTIIRDSILINFTESYCFDTISGNGAVVSITNECPNQDGDVEFFLDDDQYCLSYTGDSIGIDTACIRIEYENGRVDSITFIVEVFSPSPELINVDLMVGNSDTFCLDLTELAGLPDESTLIDICDSLNGTNAVVILDTMNLCVEITGLEVGVDSSCIVICDNFGVCDTTYFVITVSDTITNPLDTLMAVDDFASTDINDDVVINILGNDIIPDNELDTLFILTDPENGSVSIDISGLVIYDPVIDFCGTDSFTYVICDTLRCDTALVIVEVVCDSEPEDLFIPEGFSPNGDNIGDTWIITGLDQFPNTNVMIYNRWGNKVYESNDYQNDWNGTWDNNPLPDGTYFYLIDFRNGEDPQTGYVVILR